MRDVLIHEYFGVNLRTVWRTAKHDIRPLLDAVVRLIEEQDSGAKRAA